MAARRTLKLIWRNLIVLMLIYFSQVRSDYISGNTLEQVRRYTRWQEFDYVTWTIDALFLKQQQAALSLPRYLDSKKQRELVLAHLDLVRQRDRVQNEINTIYADPAVIDPQRESAELSAQLAQLDGQINRQAPLVEAILQHQVSVIIAEMGLGLGGQPFPPPLYHVTSLPRALIVSPREVIRQDADISLQPDLTLEQITRLEREVEDGLNVSSLVVQVGGVGIYPTMVMSTTDLRWLAEVVAHEWTHNFLTLRPLGVLYYDSPEMRIINETTATIAGKEIGDSLLARYYPEFLPPPEPPAAEKPAEQPETEAEPQRFDFRAEMRETRVRVDALLAEGRIEEAESYMEQRRQVFWENGYRIRRLNQAYFAFHGAYADQPGGAAGEDPVGAAVRALRASSPHLASFLNRISWVTSYQALQRLTN